MFLCYNHGMKVTPITKEYTNSNLSSLINVASKGGAKKADKNVFCSPKTIVQKTPNEFSNSRGTCLADIDLTDAFVPAKDDFKIDIQFTGRNQFLADMALTDSFVKSDKKKSNVSFDGIYPDFLVDQDAAEQYETTSEGINDIYNSSYCNFAGAEHKPLLFKLGSFIKRNLM